MGVVISAVLPIALVALCGVWVGRAFQLDIKTITRLNIYVLLPALVLTGVYSSSLEIGTTVRIVVGFLLNCVVLYGVAIALSRKLQLSADTRKSLIATTLLANTGNIGLPFILFALGEAALERAIVYLVTSAIFIASVGPTFLKGQGIRSGLKITVHLPVFWATIAGIGLQTFTWKVPLAIDRALELMADAAIPIALLLLGVQLSRIPVKIGTYELIATALRLVVSPLSAYAIGQLLRLEGLDLAVLVMQSSMPVAVNTLIWVTEFGGDTVRVAKTIVLSTALSFATLPTVLWLITR